MIGPILCFYFMTRRVKPTFPPKARRFHMAEIAVAAAAAGRSVGDVEAALPGGAQLTMVRQGGPNVVPSPGLVLAAGDAVILAADTADAIAQAASTIGHVPADFDGITVHTAVIGSLLPVTAGNVVGGAVLVAGVYWFIYLRKRRRHLAGRS